MADGIKISEMTEVTGLLGSDLIPLVSEGRNRKIKKENLFNAIRNEMIIHSETEQVVGKWIDGTTDVYEKTYFIPTLSNVHQTITIDNSINCDNILPISINAFMYSHHYSNTFSRTTHYYSLHEIPLHIHNSTYSDNNNGSFNFPDMSVLVLNQNALYYHSQTEAREKKNLTVTIRYIKL